MTPRLFSLPLPKEASIGFSLGSGGIKPERQRSVGPPVHLQIRFIAAGRPPPEGEEL